MSASASTSRPCQVSGVVIAAAAPLSGARGNTVSGGQGTPERPVRLLLRCAHVVAACGALHTPALLLRSGVAIAFQYLLLDNASSCHRGPQAPAPWTGSLVFKVY